MRIGLFGGSFNPIHNGHIALGTTMLSAMSLDEVWYLVSPLNPWKTEATDLLDEKLRLYLTEKALEEYPRLKASDYEFHMPQPNYSWQTLQHLKEDFPQHDFILIIGGDNMARFEHWANHDYILKNFHVAVFPREGAKLDYELKRFKDLGRGITIVDVPKINITSTQIRQLVKQGQDISKYVPHNIIESIIQNYKNNKCIL